MNEARQGLRFRGFEEDAERIDVVATKVVDGRPVIRAGGAMDDDIDVVQHGMAKGGIEEVAALDGDAEIIEEGRVGGGTKYGDDGLASPRQGFGDVAAEKTGGAGEKIMHEEQFREAG